MNSSPFNPEFFIAIVYLCAVNMSLFVVVRGNVGSARTGLDELFFFILAVHWTKGPWGMIKARVITSEKLGEVILMLATNPARDCSGLDLSGRHW